MDENITYQLKAFVTELSAFSFSDPLVSISTNTKTVFHLKEINFEKHVIAYSSQFNQLYKTAVQNKKESDINSLCLAFSAFDWKIKEKSCLSPLFLIPIHCSWNKIKQEFIVHYELENIRLNPFIENSLWELYNYRFELSNTSDVDKLIHSIQEQIKAAELPISLLEFKAIGNFHHHRYEILKDLEELIQQENYGNLIREILGETPTNLTQKLNLDSRTCFPSDTDQSEVISSFCDNNIVVQGPPGTGKTQLLANCISKLLNTGEKHLVLSEKKTALTVLEKKLAEKDLDHFVYLTHSNSKSSEFIQKLKSTWSYVENLEIEEKIDLQLSKNYLNQIQFVFDKLNSNPIWGDLSLDEIREICTGKNLHYVSNPLDYTTWINSKNDIEQVYTICPNVVLLSKIKPVVFSQQVDLQHLIKQGNSYLSRLNSLVESPTLNAINELNKHCIFLQILENDAVERFKELLSSEKNIKKYYKLLKQYQEKQSLFEFKKTEFSIWKIIPTLIQIESWEKGLNQGNWFKKRQIKKDIFKQFKAKQVDFTIALSHTKQLLLLEKELLNLEIQFQHFGITQINSDLNIINYVLLEKKKFNSLDWEKFIALEPLKRKEILELASDIRQIQSLLNNHFKLDGEQNIKAFLKDLEVNLSAIIQVRNIVENLPNEVFNHFNLAQTITDLETIYIHSNWVNITSKFIDLQHFNGDKLINLLSQIEREENKETMLFSAHIRLKIKKKFNALQQLLQQVNSKLTPDEKEFKQRLKLGKSILVKEFAKSKQHKSIRELLQTDAQLWIELLLPIFLSTSSHLSQIVPLEKNYFNCLIIDEASQLPLAKSIPALYRAKRVLIAGDENQMSPNQLFSNMKCGVDILHQASYFLKQKKLKHHYRSRYQELIYFSNKHFYKSELIVYPTYNKKANPLNLHYISNGIFVNRTNEEEAIALAKKLESLLHSNQQIGVVAFSEKQLSLIWNKINVNYYDLLQEKITKNQLFFKAVEQVQGEECDILLISFGYGKDEQGNFHQRFGPLNQITGSKRLNVLLTRAKEEIHFFTSVQSTDFKLSTNEAVNLLRLFLYDLEHKQFKNTAKLPHQIDATFERNKITIPQIYKQLTNAAELKTFHQLMRSRNWEITYSI